MNTKLMIAGMALVTGLGAAIPAHAENLRLDIHGRRFGIRAGFYAPPVVVVPVVVAPAPVWVAPAPVVVEDPLIVAGGYYRWEGGRRVFYRGRPDHFRR